MNSLTPTDRAHRTSMTREGQLTAGKGAYPGRTGTIGTRRESHRSRLARSTAQGHQGTVPIPWTLYH